MLSQSRRARACLAWLLIGGGAAGLRAADELPGFADAITNVVDKAAASVVNIKAVVHGQARAPLFYDPMYDQFFFGRPNNVVPQRQGEGSGFVYDQSGLVMTNEHVVEDADEIVVTLSSGAHYKARIQGVDPSHDVAILKVEDKDFKGFAPGEVAVLGDSGALKVGSWAVAIGSPFSLEKSVTAGIISALGRHLQIDRNREYFNLIQTDAAINPGNSGGPLLNLKGEVIAINTAINPAGQGLGFAIPINLAKKIGADLVAHGSVQRTWLGVELGEVTQAMARHLGLDHPTGVYLARVIPGGPAAKAGLQPGDVVLSVRGRPIDDGTNLVEQVQETGVGNPIALEVITQDGTRRPVQVMVAPWGETGEGQKAEAEPRGARASSSFGPLGIRGITLSKAKRPPKDTPSGLEGVLVLEVERGGRGARFDLRVGDVIQKVGRTPTPTAEDLEAALAGGALDKDATVTIFREGYWHFLAE